MSHSVHTFKNNQNRFESRMRHEIVVKCLLAPPKCTNQIIKICGEFSMKFTPIYWFISFASFGCRHSILHCIYVYIAMNLCESEWKWSFRLLCIIKLFIIYIYVELFGVLQFQRKSSVHRPILIQMKEIRMCTVL